MDNSLLQHSTSFVLPLAAPCARACLKIHSRHLHAPSRPGRFAPNSVSVAHYASFIGDKSPTKCDAQLTKSNFQTRSEGDMLRQYRLYFHTASPCRRRSACSLPLPLNCLLGIKAGFQSDINQTGLLRYSLTVKPALQPSEINCFISVYHSPEGKSTCMPEQNKRVKFVAKRVNENGVNRNNCTNCINPSPKRFVHILQIY